MHIYQGNSEPWKQWATQLCLQHRDTPATFKEVLSEFRRHAGLLRVAGSAASQEPSVLSAEAGKKQCATDGCSRLVSGKGRRWCNPCHSAYKSKQELELTPKAANALQQKKDKKRKQDFAKKKDKNNKKTKSAGAAEAHNATAEADSDEGIKIGASDMSSSEDSGSEDEPSPSEAHAAQGSDADDTALRKSIQALEEWTQAHTVQECKKADAAASKAKTSEVAQWLVRKLPPS